LVPEGREELTTEGGLHLAAVYQDFKNRVFPAIRGGAGAKVEISLFVDPNPDDIKGAINLGSDAIELHTGTYANATTISAAQKELNRLIEAAKMAHAAGLKVNAGHGLNQQNLAAFLRAVPHLADISIGHALISEAVYDGLAKTVKAYLSIIEQIKEEQHH
jgi:pyridoxine 5-phosphate synthase